MEFILRELSRVKKNTLWLSALIFVYHIAKDSDLPLCPDPELSARETGSAAFSIGSAYGLNEKNNILAAVVVFARFGLFPFVVFLPQT